MSAVANHDAPIVFGRSITMRLVERAAQLTRISIDDILGPCRYQDISWTRFAIMAVAHERGLTYASIARALGLRNHTSILHGSARAAEIAERDPDFAKLLKLLRAEVAQ